MTLRDEAEKAARVFDCGGRHDCPMCTPNTADNVADAIERVAREFAEKVVREIARVGHPQTPLGQSSLWAVSAMMPQVDGLFGLGFTSEANAESWLEKSIAAAVAAAERG